MKLKLELTTDEIREKFLPNISHETGVEIEIVETSAETPQHVVANEEKMTSDDLRLYSLSKKLDKQDEILQMLKELLFISDDYHHNLDYINFNTINEHHKYYNAIKEWLEEK